jgi:hypothetical protein
MELICKEQPFLNFLIVTSGLNYTSLQVLLDSIHYPQNYVEYWAGHRKKYLRGQLKALHYGKLREIFLIHWAGVWQPKRWEIKLFRLLSVMRLRRTMWLASLVMPLKPLWNSYRKQRHTLRKEGGDALQQQ